MGHCISTRVQLLKTPDLSSCPCFCFLCAGYALVLTILFWTETAAAKPSARRCAASAPAESEHAHGNHYEAARDHAAQNDPEDVNSADDFIRTLVVSLAILNRFALRRSVDAIVEVDKAALALALV